MVNTCEVLDTTPLKSAVFPSSIVGRADRHAAAAPLTAPPRRSMAANTARWTRSLVGHTEIF